MKKMKKIWIPLSTLTFLIVAGCSTDSIPLDVETSSIQIVNGKSYQIPKGAKISPYSDVKVIQFYQKIGLTYCKEGDITWETFEATDKMSAAIGDGNKDVYKKLAKENRIGCASPLK